MHELPADQKQLALTFDELAALLGCGLSHFTRTRQEGWANTGTAPWLVAGWKVEKLWLKNRIVVFRRAGTEPPHERIQDAVQRLLDGDEMSCVDPCQVADWIKFCSRHRLYFHGKVLYDRMNQLVGSLDEHVRVEVEQDYRNCCRELNRYREARVSVAMSASVG